MYPVVATESPEVASPGKQSSARLRIFELVLVLFVALATPIANSTYAAIYGISPSLLSSNFRYIAMIVHEAGALILVWYVLQRSGRTFASLGLQLSIKGFFTGLGLALLSTVAAYATWFALQLGHKYVFGSYITVKNLLTFFPTANWASVVVLVLINPFFEEIIVRGFLTTEVSELTGSVLLGTLTSIIVQTSYHIYQGWASATCLFAIFSVLATYYARKRKLFPPIVAHLVADLSLLTRMR
jgi:membrane protease YdiL (CAAX protease family)